jgi:hypothetical protein
MHIVHILVETKSVTSKGAILKVVKCEGCGDEYVYKLERTATGVATGVRFVDEEGKRARASANAETLLNRKLERGVDVVPCPACGRIQQHMIPPCRRRRWRWMLNLGVLLIVLACVGGCVGAVINSVVEDQQGAPLLPWHVFFAALAVAAALGPALMIARFVAVSRHDPNAEDEERRIRQGQERAALRNDLEAWRQQNGEPPS